MCLIELQSIGPIRKEREWEERDLMKAAWSKTYTPLLHLVLLILNRSLQISALFSQCDRPRTFDYQQYLCTTMQIIYNIMYRSMGPKWLYVAFGGLNSVFFFFVFFFIFYEIFTMKLCISTVCRKTQRR